MRFRAVIKQSGGWWIGWLVDLPGVNAQERTREELEDALRMGADDMLNAPLTVDDEESELITIDIGG